MTTFSPDRTPIVLGYGRNRLKPRSTPAGQQLHRAGDTADAHGLRLHCNSGHGLRILQPAAILPTDNADGADGAAAVLDALHTLAVDPARLCRRCFRDIRPTYWEQRTARHRREVTVSADAAALIARVVAFRDHEPPPPAGEASDGPRTATLSGHADAIIAGLVAPLDLEVRHKHINASDQTWAEIHAAFPLALHARADIDSMDITAVFAEIREVFPAHIFTDWADLAGQFTDQISHFYRGQIQPPAKRPCGTCPYRRDVPSGIWAEEEYEKLSRYDAETMFQPPATFLCHLAERGGQLRRVCAGWAGCHDGWDLLSLRLAVSESIRDITTDTYVAICEYTSPVPLFATGAEAAAHGLRDMLNPSEAAATAIDKILRVRPDIVVPGRRNPRTTPASGSRDQHAST